MQGKYKLRKVLLIDDDKITNFVNSRLIKKNGQVEHIDVALNGLEAISYLDSLSQKGDDLPDLVLLDVNMPGMNGWEFLESYAPKLKGFNEMTTIVMLSTSLNPDDKTKAESFGVVARYVTKPLTDDVLQGIVSDFFV